MLKVSLIFIFNDNLILADQPVKCKKKGGSINYVGGTWTFHATPEPQTVNLYETMEVCGHNKPNSIQIIDQEYQFEMDPPFDVWKIKILDDDRVSAVKVGGSEVFGEWDILYDQTLVIQLSSGLRFVANFMYKIYPKLEDGLVGGPVYDQELSRIGGITTHGRDRFSMNCNQTMTGFIQIRNDTEQNMKNHKIQCFFGSFAPSTTILYQKEFIIGEESS